MPTPSGGVTSHNGASRIIPAIPRALAPRPRQHKGLSQAQAPPSQRDTNDISVKQHRETNATDNEPSAQHETSYVPNGSVTPTPAPPSPSVLGHPATARNGVEGASHQQEGGILSPQAPTQQPVPETAAQYTKSASILGKDRQPSLSKSGYMPPPLSNSPTVPLPHESRPSVNNLVFGSHGDSGTSSPLPPTNGTASSVSQPATSSHSAVHPAAPPFVPNGHAYHFSEPYAGPTFAPPFAPGPHAYYPRDPFSMGSQSFSPSRPYFPSQVRSSLTVGRPDEYSFPPQYPPLNARPNAYYQPAPIPAKEYSRAIRPNMMGPQTPSQYQQLRRDESTNMRSDYQSPHDSHASSDPPLERDPHHDPHAAAALGYYLQRQFANLNFADSLLRFDHSMNIYPADAVPAHAIILSRSPKLDSFMAMQDRNAMQFEGSMKVLNVTITDRFLSNSAAFVKAIHRLYAGPLPEAGDLPPGGEMYFALSFAAAGHFLQMDEIVSRGLDLAASQLRWDTVNKALAFALDGGLSASWVHRDMSGEDLDSSSSYGDSPSKLGSPTSAPTYGFYSDRLLQAVIDFLVVNCPTDFKFSPDAPQLADSPRLPAEAEQKHSRSSSRLSRIRFGEMTIDEHSSPQSPVTTTWSSILVSLPFPILKYVLEHTAMVDRLGKASAAELMQVIVDEREERRRRVSNSAVGAAPDSALEERLWQNVRWAEMTERSEQQPSGSKLVRRRLGEETPTSSQSAKS